jgi:hypothetical protein
MNTSFELESLLSSPFNPILTNLNLNVTIID